MFKVYIMVSGGGPSIDVVTVNSLDEGTGVVLTIEELWKLWQKVGFPQGWPYAITHFEGCDVYAHDTQTNKRFTYTDEWELVDG